MPPVPKKSGQQSKGSGPQTLRFYRLKMGQHQQIDPITGEKRLYKIGERVASTDDLARKHGAEKFELVGVKKVDMKKLQEQAKKQPANPGVNHPSVENVDQQPQPRQGFSKDDAIQKELEGDEENGTPEERLEESRELLKSREERLQSGSEESEEEDDQEDGTSPKAKTGQSDEEELEDLEDEETEEQEEVKSRDELQGMRVSELREYAEERGIELGSAVKKSEIIDEISKYS
jgi:hypothetical protein